MTLMALGDTARFINGAAFKPTDWKEEGLPIIRIQNLTGTGEKFNLTTRTVKPELIVEPGDLLVSWSATLDVYRWAGPRGVLNQHIFKVLPNSDIDPEYLFFVLKNALAELSSKTHGSTMKHVVRGDFESTQVNVPPIAEQRRIVDLLSRAEGIVRLRREAEKKSAELIPALFLEMFGDPATNPKGWQTAKFGSLGQCRLGKMLDKKNQSGDYQRPYLRNVNVQWDRIDTHDLLTMDFHPDEQATFLVHPGDVLICEGGEIGRAAVWTNQIHECYYQKALHKLTPDKSIVRADFVVWLLWHLARKKAFGTSGHATIAHLTGVQLKGLSVIAPPVGLQVEFENQVERVHSIQMQQTTANAKAKAAFDALLSSAFSR